MLLRLLSLRFRAGAAATRAVLCPSSKGGSAYERFDNHVHSRLFRLSMVHDRMHIPTTEPRRVLNSYLPPRKYFSNQQVDPEMIRIQKSHAHRSLVNK